MLTRLKDLLRSILESLRYPASRLAGGTAEAAGNGARRVVERVGAARWLLVGLAFFGAAGYLTYKHPPVKSVARGEIGIHANRISGEVTEWREGNVFVFPGVHDLR